MNTRGEKSLATRAKQQISICCETLCERAPVEEYIKQLEERIAQYETIEKERHESRRRLRKDGLYEKG